MAFGDPNHILKETALISRFLEYVRMDTQSSESSETCPSTQKQLVLAKKLVGELRELGLSDANLDENGYVTGTLPGNRRGGQTIGFLAHLDTSPACSGEGVKPLIHESYDGKAISLIEGVVIRPEENPQLASCVGDTIITADGTTLLGADDKAGIAEILAAVEYLVKHPELPRPTIKVGFTPDEEIGKGAAKFPIETFGADVAFTLDGGFDGEINLETFNADSAFVTMTGVSTHPGTAKNKLVNALRYMAIFLEKLPKEQAPETTEGREGFIHPYDLSGDASRCKAHLILRDFEKDKLEALGQKIRDIADAVAQLEPRLKIDVEIRHSYPNMHEFLMDKPEIAQRLNEAVRLCGLTPRVEPIRGGTDGANLSRMGLPCPNIFAGGVNFHGPTEWISTRSMGLAVCTILNLIDAYA
ncbi:MAG: peptidase T [Myxococcota bacterium]|jgi:tripeptide aminopeptidase|nr:peptidase T [Myxococcota bacterium]